MRLELCAVYWTLAKKVYILLYEHTVRSVMQMQH